METKRYSKYIGVSYKFISFFLFMNSSFTILFALAGEYDSPIKSTDFEEAFFRNEVEFEKIDSSNNQFNSFFGGENYYEKNNFSDLAIPYYSREIRELYNKKLFQMLEIETNDYKDSFFTEKL